MTTAPLSATAAAAGTARASAQPARSVDAPSGSSSTTAAAHHFEAMAIAAFLKPMFKDFGKAEAPFGGGNTFRMFRPYLVQAIAEQMEQDGGLGLEPAVARALGTRAAAPTPQATPDAASLLQPGSSSWTTTPQPPRTD